MMSFQRDLRVKDTKASSRSSHDGNLEMKNTSQKALAFIFTSLIYILAGVGLASGQRRAGESSISPLRSKQTTQNKAQRRPGKWYIFTSPDHDFTIEFPSKPAREEDAPGIVGVIRRYSSTTDTYYFGIVYQDVGHSARDLTPTHEESTAALLEERGHKIISVRRLSKNTSQTELWSPSQTPGKFLHRIDRTIVSNDRIYTLGCSSRVAEREVDKAMCRRFFGSFRVTGPPQ